MKYKQGEKVRYEYNGEIRSGTITYTHVQMGGNKEQRYSIERNGGKEPADVVQEKAIKEILPTQLNPQSTSGFSDPIPTHCTDILLTYGIIADHVRKGTVPTKQEVMAMEIMLGNGLANLLQHFKDHPVRKDFESVRVLPKV